MPRSSSVAGDVCLAAVLDSGLLSGRVRGPVAAGRYSTGRFCPPDEWMSMRWNALEAEAQLCPELLEVGTSKKFSKLQVSAAI